MKKKLILIRGLPGAGKSTLAKFIVGEEEYAHLETDMFFLQSGEYLFDYRRIAEAHEWCQKEVELLMGKGFSPLVVSNTFTREGEMEPYIKMAKTYDYEVTSIIVENLHGSGSIHNVPQETIQKMRSLFEVRL